jgi:hypothetical protein
MSNYNVLHNGQVESLTKSAFKQYKNIIYQFEKQLGGCIEASCRQRLVFEVLG